MNELCRNKNVKKQIQNKHIEKRDQRKKWKNIEGKYAKESKKQNIKESKRNINKLQDCEKQGITKREIYKKRKREIDIQRQRETARQTDRKTHKQKRNFNTYRQKNEKVGICWSLVQM